MDTQDKKDTQENAVNVGIRFEVPEEEPLKSERVEEALRAMPDWQVTLEGQAITRAKDLPTPEVASQYTAYVTGFAGSLGLPVAVSVSDGLVLVTVYARRNGDCMGGLTESVLDFASQIG
jgi:pterin-4a-carbinolamine dehydratase